MEKNNFGLTTNLTLEIEKTNSLLTKWYEQKMQNVEKLENEYSSVMAECEITGKSLFEKNQQLEISRPINQAIKDQYQREVENVKHVVNQNRLQVQSMASYLKEMEILEAQLLEKQQLIKKEHDYLKRAMEQKLQDFTHGTKFYQKLGLEFQKTADDRMKFVFTQIDVTDPRRSCYFTIYVDQNNLYQLVETSPALPREQTDEMISKLNENNNIAIFVLQMRKSFKAVINNA